MRKPLVDAALDDVQALNVPAETAPVPATDHVTCVHCRQLVPLARTDVVGLGYRCQACSLRAEVEALDGRNDVGDHLPADDRLRFAERARRFMLLSLAAFAVLAILGLGLLFAAPRSAVVWWKPLTSAATGSLIALSYSLDRWRRFRIRAA